MAASPPRPGAQQWVPASAGLPGLAEAARGCEGCELFGPATQTVFGTGAPTARVVLIGEQPGDQEDRSGTPFIGPAGRLLDQALTEAGIDRGEAYVTNAVKHFRFTQAGPGKRRIHQSPELAHLSACRPWLNAELSVLDPELVVALGASAGKSLLGSGFRVTKSRGTLLPLPEPDEETATHARWLLPTIHPSAVLRADDRDAAYAGLVADLRVGADVLR